jgi:outer membrane biosynthesis protein TonB
VAEGGTVQLLNAAGDPVTAVAVAEGNYVLDPATGVITFTPARGFTGPAPAVSFQVSDAYGQIGEATYTATVTVDPAVTPSPDPSPDPTIAPDPAPVTIPTQAPTADPVVTTEPAPVPTPSLTPGQPVPSVQPSTVTKAAVTAKSARGTTDETTASTEAYTDLDAFPINAERSLPTAKAAYPHSDDLKSWWFAWCMVVCVGALAIGRSLHRRW